MPNLIGQQTIADNLAPKIQNLKTQMDARKTVWEKCSRPKKKAWVQSGKDPIMTLAWQIYKYLSWFFKDEVDDD